MFTVGNARSTSRAILAGLVLAAAAACGEAPSDEPRAMPMRAPDRLGELRDRLFTSRDLLLLVSRNWSFDPSIRATHFAGFATLACQVNRVPVVQLEITLIAAAESRGRQVRVLWDDVELPASPVTLSDTSTVTVARDRLTVGLHTLLLMTPEEAGEERIAFSRIKFQAGSGPVVITPRSPADAYLNSFLAWGVTGVEERRLGGFLFEGPQQQSLEVSLDQPHRLVGEAENASDAAATFSASIGATVYQRSLRSMERFRYDYPLPAGETAVRFAVDGSHGYYLWGAPHLVPLLRLDAPPIVLVTLDTTRRDALSAYGGSPDLTPDIAELSRHATVYERALSASPWTLPSHASLFTGLYPSRHGAGFNRDGLGAELTSLARLLRDSGYVTGGFAGGLLCSARYGLGHGFDVYQGPEGFEVDATTLTDRALEFVRAYRDETFFLFVNYFDPHQPYAAPAAFAARLGVEEARQALPDLAVWRDLAAGRPLAWNDLNSGRAPESSAGRDFLRAAYLAEVSYMDSEIGRLLDGLRQIDGFDRALIVLVADHGELLGEGGHYGHAYRLDPELTEVPLIVKWPHQSRPQRVAGQVSLLDLFPTLLRAAGVAPPGSDGTLLPAADRERSRTGEAAYMEEHGSVFHSLRTEIKIADHVYGVQHADTRQVAWDGGASCARLRWGRWVEVPCPASPAAMLTELEQRLGPAPQSGTAGPVLLTQEDEAGLRALGYLK